MKTRPIIFSGPMIRAILDGRKIQTRRVIKPQPLGEVTSAVCWEDGLWRIEHTSVKRPAPDIGTFVGVKTRCSYGVPGDRLWVRETWAASSVYDDLAPSDFPIDGYSQHLWYLADGLPQADPSWRGHGVGRTRPSIFMPRWASRITLEVTDVRVERVQDITDHDCKAEGVTPEVVAVGAINEGIWEPSYCTGTQSSYYQPFIRLWNGVNAKRGFGWDMNPWVFVISFVVCKEEQCS